MKHFESLPNNKCIDYKEKNLYVSFSLLFKVQRLVRGLRIDPLKPHQDYKAKVCLFMTFLPNKYFNEK